MERAGWLVFHPNGGLAVSKWERHNGRSAKRRAMDRQRQTRRRSAQEMPPFPGGGPEDESDL
jgi:hypothetical protein